jgi:hypothetical protein
MFIEGGSKSNETVLMSLTGNDLNEISILTDKMRIPGGDDLKKAKGKKIKTIYSITIFFSLLPVVLEPTQKYFVENTENKDFIAMFRLVY